MDLKPRVFISAVSSEFREVRQSVALTLQRLGYDPVLQEVFGTETGDLRDVLRRRIDECEGLIHIVGYAYGAEPPTVDSELGRSSYTQYEYLYARQKPIKTWVLVLGENCTRTTPIDQLDLPNPDSEVEDAQAYQRERRQLQDGWRKRLSEESEHLFHRIESDDRLALHLEQLRDEFSELRVRMRKWQARQSFVQRFTLALAILICVACSWLAYSVGKANATIEGATGQIVEMEDTLGDVQSDVVDVQEKVTSTAESTSRLATESDISAALDVLKTSAATMDLTESGQVNALELILQNGRAPVTLRGMDLSGLQLREETLARKKFDGSRLNDSALVDCDLEGITISFAQLQNARFSNSNLAEVLGRFLDATNSRFDGAIMRQAAFFGSDFEGSDFRGADLRGTNFAFCNLSNCVFDRADLTDACLTASILKGASFEGAMFGNTDVTGAVLSSERLSEEQFAGLVAMVDEMDSINVIIDHPLLFGSRASNLMTGYFVDVTWPFNTASTRELPVNHRRMYAPVADSVMIWSSETAFPLPRIQIQPVDPELIKAGGRFESVASFILAQTKRLQELRDVPSPIHPERTKNPQR